MMMSVSPITNLRSLPDLNALRKLGLKNRSEEKQPSGTDRQRLDEESPLDSDQCEQKIIQCSHIGDSAKMGCDFADGDLHDDGATPIDVPSIKGPCSIDSLKDLSHGRATEPFDVEQEQTSKTCLDEAAVDSATCREEEECKRLDLDDGYVNILECSELAPCQLQPQELGSLEQRFREGWTDQEAGNITVAEVFTILNQPEKVYLHYEWLDDEPEVTSSSDMARVEAGKLARALRKLIELARTEFVDANRLKQVRLWFVQISRRDFKLCPGGGGVIQRTTAR